MTIFRLFQIKRVCRQQFPIFENGKKFLKQVDSSKLKEFAGNSFQFNENGKKFLNRIENSVGKGGIASLKEKKDPAANCYRKHLGNMLQIFHEQTLIVTSNFFLPTVFSKELYCRHVKTRACFRKG